MADAFNFSKLLSDPNFQQYLGNAGAAFSSGKSAGEALNPSQMIRNQKSQEGGLAALKQIFGELPTKVGEPGSDKSTITIDGDGKIVTTSTTTPNKANPFAPDQPLELIPKPQVTPTQPQTQTQALAQTTEMPSTTGVSAAASKANPLSELDLRGLAPEDVQALVHNALAVRGMQGQERLAGEGHDIDRAGLEVRKQKAAAALAEAERKANQVTYSEKYPRDGKLVRDILVGGNKVGEDILGEADIPGKILQNDEGEMRLFPDSELINPVTGWKQPVDEDTKLLRELTAASKERVRADKALEFKDTIDLYQNAVISGEVGKNRTPISEENRDMYMNMHNRRVEEGVKTGVIPATAAQIIKKTDRWFGPKYSLAPLNTGPTGTLEEPPLAVPRQMRTPEPPPAPEQPPIPEVGDVMRGYKFKGGDPSDKDNWEKVQ